MDADGFEIETLMNVRALRTGLRIVEVPSFEAPRVFGEGRLRAFPDGWRILKTLVREWRHAALTPSIRTLFAPVIGVDGAVRGAAFELES